MKESSRMRHFCIGFLLPGIVGINFLFALEPLEIEYQSNAHCDYLEPVPSQHDEYEDLLQKKLLVTSGDYGRMLFLPSFTGEWAVSVYNKEPQSQGSVKYCITLTEAKKNLYYSFPENNDQKKRKDVIVRRTDVEIDREFAVKIQRAWATYILETRYSKTNNDGVDGYVARFSVWVRGEGNIQGQVWTPSRGLPLEFVELGFALVDYCKAPERKHPILRKEILEKLSSFTERVKNP